MLDIRLEIAQVNYQKCVEVLLPQLVEHCASKESPNELDKFLAKLGPDAAPAACALLDDMSVDAKDKMVVWLVSAHEERMRNSANRHLAELLGAPIIRIGHFLAIDRPGSRLTLLAEQVNTDYPALLRSPLVEDGVDQIGSENGILKSAAKLALQMGRRMSGENLEKQGLLLLNSAKVKSKLTEVLQEAVRQAGLDVTLEDVSVERSGAILLPEQLSKDEGLLPDAFEDELLDALARRARAMHKQ